MTWEPPGGPPTRPPLRSPAPHDRCRWRNRSTYERKRIAPAKANRPAWGRSWGNGTIPHFACRTRTLARKRRERAPGGRCQLAERRQSILQYRDHYPHRPGAGCALLDAMHRPGAGRGRGRGWGGGGDGTCHRGLDALLFQMSTGAVGAGGACVGGGGRWGKGFGKGRKNGGGMGQRGRTTRVGALALGMVGLMRKEQHILKFYELITDEPNRSLHHVYYVRRSGRAHPARQRILAGRARTLCVGTRRACAAAASGRETSRSIPRAALVRDVGGRGCGQWQEKKLKKEQQTKEEKEKEIEDKQVEWRRSRSRTEEEKETTKLE
ncbi:Protein of unknown function [Gryllus bimaculatus]|nr:Protein of unknown function [Gryllus bimaculatus]